jgi:hypothetical protein
MIEEAKNPNAFFVEFDLSIEIGFSSVSVK